MTCRAAISRGTPAAIGLGPTREAAADHIPILSEYDATTGCAPCKRCGQPVSSGRWSTEPCPGRPFPQVPTGVMSLEALDEAIDRRAAVIAWHRREIREQEAEMEQLFKERKERMTKPAGTTAAKEIEHG